MYPDERRILLTPGPVVFSIDNLRYMLSTVYEHTSIDFAEIYGRAIKKFRSIIGANGNFPVFMFSGSGTLAMEASLINILKPGSRILVVSHGFFGDRWAEIARVNGYDVKVLYSDVGDIVDLGFIAEELSKGGYDALLVTHVETSTGVRADVRSLASIASKYNTLIFVDGVSSVAAEPLDCSRWGVDVLVTTSQKALETPPGVSIVALCTSRAVKALEANNGNVRSFYMRLSDWRKVMEAYEDGRIAYHATPPTHLIVALERALTRILEEGLEARFKRHYILAKALREGIRALGLEVVAKREEIASNTVTAVYTPQGVDPIELRRRLARGNIIIALPLHPALRGKSFRIGHMGSVNHNDIVAVVALLERTLASMGVKIELGSGLRAVQQILLTENL
ncbi:MAG: alanine--glyoxylate aminotransferase family protein [Acidilobaceae archaeon]